MPPRRPIAAPRCAPIPSLLTFVAGVAAVEGCAPVECGGERIDELAAHGPSGAEALRRGELRSGLRQVAVAAGILPHSATRVDLVTPGGAPPPVTETPVQPPGGISIAGPTQPPPEPRIEPEGGIRAVTPTPPPSQNLRGGRRPASAEPRE